jgi:hypothetical protein
MSDPTETPRPEAPKLDAVGKLRVDTLHEKIRDLVMSAPPDQQRKLVRIVSGSGAAFFRSLVDRIGDTEARSVYAAHILIGSTPAAHVSILDHNGECEAEMTRILEVIRSELTKSA